MALAGGAPTFVLHPLPSLGRSLPADSDHFLGMLTGGTMLLINVPPGLYAFEEHTQSEFIVCVTGTLTMESEAGLR